MMGGERLDISVRKCLIHRASMKPVEAMCEAQYVPRTPRLSNAIYTSVRFSVFHMISIIWVNEAHVFPRKSAAAGPAGAAIAVR